MKVKYEFMRLGLKELIAQVYGGGDWGAACVRGDQAILEEKTILVLSQ